MRSCSDVHNLLLEEGIPHEIVQLPGSARTAQLAADRLGVSVSEVVKSLVFLVDDEPVMVLSPGDASVDTEALARELSGREAVLARAQQVHSLTGYRPGAVRRARSIPTFPWSPIRVCSNQTWCTVAAARRRRCSRSEAPICARSSTLTSRP